MRTVEKSINPYIFPEWSTGNELKVFFWTVISILGGFGSAVLLHYEYYIGIYVWPIGLVGFCHYLLFYFKGKYQHYMDCGWDIYY